MEAEQALEQLRQYAGPAATVLPTVRPAAGKVGLGDTLVLKDSPTLVLPAADGDNTLGDDQVRERDVAG